MAHFQGVQRLGQNRKLSIWRVSAGELVMAAVSGSIGALFFARHDNAEHHKGAA